jgi:hypothetical protein
MRSHPYPARQAGTQARGAGRANRTAREPASGSPTCRRRTVRRRSSTSQPSAAYITSATQGLKTPLYEGQRTRRSGNVDCAQPSDTLHQPVGSRRARGSMPTAATPTRCAARSQRERMRRQTRRRYPDHAHSRRADAHRRRRAIEPRLYSSVALSFSASAMHSRSMCIVGSNSRFFRSSSRCGTSPKRP